MIMREAITKLISVVKNEYVVCANGFISRDTFNAEDRPRNFYMLGSMGQVLSIALGLAMTRLERVVALDGDGNVLMGLGGLAMVGGLKPANLYHLVLDNGCYATTGGQPALSQKMDLASAAVGSGYAWGRRCFSGDRARDAMESWLAAKGPALLDLEVTGEDPEPAPRVPMTPEEMATRTRAALASA